MFLVSITLLLWLAPAFVLAAPYRGYTYNSRNQAVLAPQAYLAAKVVNSQELGISPLSDPRDMVVSPKNNIYLADTGNNRVICIDQNWRVFKIIGGLNSPTGLFVTQTEELYVADRDNGRILHFDENQELVREIGAPSDSVIPDEFRYRPSKVAVDPIGRIYVIADGVYDGLIEFDRDGFFKSYFGAPKVRPSMIDVLWRRLATEEQRKAMALFLPVEYANLELDNKGFVFAVEAGKAHQASIKKLTPSGFDVLNRTGYAPPMGDLWGESSRFVDITAREHGIFSVLDRQRGRVFTYDINGNMLYVFGGLGDAVGTFKHPMALDVLDDQILVLDLGSNQITVFRPTEYAQLIHKAIDQYEGGKLTDSIQTWKRVLALNANFDLAYVSVGRSFLSQGKYKEAMNFFKLGNDRVLYSRAFGEYRKEVIGRNFGIIVFVFVCIFVCRLVLAKPLKKFKSNLMLHIKQHPSSMLSKLHKVLTPLHYSFYVIFHPFDGFWDLKHEKRGTMASASCILTLVTLTYVFMRQYTGYIFNAKDPAALNIYMELSSVFIPFLLWCLVNWALTTLMDGKGTLKDIYIGMAYALTPIVLINVPATIISNFLKIEEGTFYYLLIGLGVGWAMLLVVIGTMVLHEYDGLKTLLTCLITIIGIGCILFIGLIFLDVINLILGFATTIYAELIFRI